MIKIKTDLSEKKQITNTKIGFITNHKTEDQQNH